MLTVFRNVMASGKLTTVLALRVGCALSRLLRKLLLTYHCYCRDTVEMMTSSFMHEKPTDKNKQEGTQCD